MVYFDRVVELLTIVPKQRILTWAETGHYNITREGKVEEKAQITAIATVTAAYTKLPLMFVAQGKTATVEES